jgi:hypothetical protein
MHNCIEKYRDLFADDLERRLSVKEDKLPPALALGLTTLLNPLFELEPRIVGCGLMTSEKYRLSRKAVILLLHDILDKRHQKMQVDTVVIISTKKYYSIPFQAILIGAFNAISIELFIVYYHKH